jgi:CheY-like chemotaxis protein
MVTDTSIDTSCVATRSQASHLFQRSETPMSDEAPLILIIEDDPAAQAVMSRRLTASGYRVIVEGDGSTGIHRAKIEQPALVISDLHMPLAPGELVILGLRLDPATAALPILVVSADPGRLGPEHRVDGILEKPVRVSELLAMVERLIQANTVTATVEATREQPPA